MPRPSARSSLTQFCRNSIKIKKPGDFFTCNTYMFFRRILYKRDEKAGRMSKFLRYLVCLLMLVMVGNAMAVTYYNCPTIKKYTSCAAEKYIDDCGSTYDGRTLASTALTVGNACLTCPSGLTCAGGTKCPAVTITYNLNGGEGTPPASTTCAQNESCTLNAGNTVNFNRDGYRLIGWSTNDEATSGAFSGTYSRNTTLYAVWEPCPDNTYKRDGTAIGSCSSCPRGYYTFGGGKNADDPGDCGRILHIGDKRILLRSTRGTSRTLNVFVDGREFYGNLDTNGNIGTVHIGDYTLYNDNEVP